MPSVQAHPDRTQKHPDCMMHCLLLAGTHLIDIEGIPRQLQRVGWCPWHNGRIHRLNLSSQTIPWRSFLKRRPCTRSCCWCPGIREFLHGLVIEPKARKALTGVTDPVGPSVLVVLKPSASDVEPRVRCLLLFQENGVQLIQRQSVSLYQIFKKKKTEN